MAKSDRHFETKTLQDNLKQRSLQSGLVSVSAQPLKFAIGIGGTVVLARLLSPADFGLLAMVQPVLSMVNALSNFGLETATVQRQDLDQNQANAVFWLSLKINALVVGGMLLSGPLLAKFYGRSELTGIVLCLALGSASLCLSFQHLSLLKRQMQFELLTAIEVASLLISTVVAIAVAVLGWSYWALVLQLVVLQVAKSIGYWLYCDWRPDWFSRSRTADKQALDSLVSYGVHLTAFRCITRLGMEMDRILLGYFRGANALGLYAVSYRWAYFPFWQIYNPLFNVAISSFSRSLSDLDRYRSYCRRGLMLLFSVYMPALAFLFVTAREFTLTMLGEQWIETIPIFRALMIAVFVGGMYRVTKWIYVSAGQTQRQFRWSLFHTPVMITAVAIGVQWGAYGVAVGYTIGMVLLTGPSVLYCVHCTPLTLGDFVSAVWRSAIASILAAGFLYLLQPFLAQGGIPIFDLLIKGLVYALAYGGIWLGLPGGLREAKQMITAFRKKLS